MLADEIIPGTTKRKAPPTAAAGQDKPKKPRGGPQPGSSNATLILPHQGLLTELNPKYHVVAASVISSTAIRKRVSYITTHILASSSENSLTPRVALLHARPAEVCKMITIAEQAKRILSEKGRPWYQYNQLFELPQAEQERARGKSRRRQVVEETVLEPEKKGEAQAGDQSESDDDDFEVMESRFEKAVGPARPHRTLESLRIVLSTVPIPELSQQSDVTSQKVGSKT